MKWVLMCQAYFVAARNLLQGYENCLRNNLSLVCNIEKDHLSMFHGQKHDFLTPLYCSYIEVFNI